MSKKMILSIGLAALFSLPCSAQPSQGDLDQSLFRAVVDGDSKMVTALFKQGANVHPTTYFSSHWSPLLYTAAGGGHDEVAKVLIKHGADPIAPNYQGYEPLYAAIKYGNPAVVEALLENGAPVNGLTRTLRWGEMNLPLTVAVDVDGDVMVNLLLAKGADVNADAGVGQRPLLRAAILPRLDLVERFLSEGADVDARGVNGHTALCAVAIRVAPEMIVVAKQLISQGADVNLANVTGITPLHRSVKGKALEMAKLLIDSNADVNREDNFGFTAYGYAATIGHEGMMELLRASGARTNVFAFGEDKPLHRAAATSKGEEIKKLVQGGADVNEVVGDGWTPLHCAVFSIYALDYKIVDYLLAHGADPNAKGPHGWPPLHISALFGRSRSLIDAGGDPTL